MKRKDSKSSFISLFLLFGVTVVVTAGCGSAVKSSLNNFTAYYNTFYNAKKSFETGLEKQKVQQSAYNPVQPIRIHPEPVNAGMEDFATAIEKSADVIRKFNDSKWVDDAVELIGKSYYYRKEFFSADQKFQELYQAAESDEVKQRSVLWRGRTYLEMQLHQQAVDLLNEQLLVFEGNWISSIKAEIKALLAQHYIALGDWERAEEELVQALDELPADEFKSRGYFLYGQVLQKNGKQEEAEKAYERVSEYFKDYALLYQANLKKAQVKRDLGKNEDAVNLLYSMVRDDKNVDQTTALEYELGRTEQERGNYDVAEDIYESVLRNNRNRPDKITLAKTYYGLGQIYQQHYNDFRVAAAYFDSAASQRVSSELLSDDFNASELARSYGEYTRLRTEIVRNDSLLWLAGLSQAELDSVILEIKKQRKAELERQMRQAENRRNTLVTVGGNQQGNNTQQNSAENGFLNFKNPVLLADARTQFQAIWGNRPLVDNWRRISAIQSADFSSEEFQGGGEQGGVILRDRTVKLSDIQVDISDIPFTEQQQDSTKMLLAELNFQLGNLFFLSLNMPDSAEYYFNLVLDDYPNSSASPVALYSLSELKANTGDMETAKSFAVRLIRKFPSTVYARRAAENFNLQSEKAAGVYAQNDSLQTAFNQIVYNNSPLTGKAQQLRELADANPESKIAPEALYQAALAYSTIAKDSMYHERINKWNVLRSEQVRQEMSLQKLKDSARVALQDTTLLETERSYWNAVKDSTIQEPDFASLFPYRGMYWDSTRSVLTEFKSRYNQHYRGEHVRRLLDEIELPAVLDTLADVGTDTVKQTEVQAQSDSSSTEYLSCADLDKDPAIAGGKSEFLDKIVYPGWIQAMAVSKEVRYKFFISSEGNIDGFELLSQSLEEDLQLAMEEAIEQHLRFIPVEADGVPQPVECEVVFNIESRPEN